MASPLPQSRNTSVPATSRASKRAARSVLRRPRRGGEAADGADAVDFAYSTSLTYFLVPGTQRFACAPVGRRLLTGARPGAARRWRCLQGSSVSANTTIYVGPETVQTPAGPVPTRHLRLLTGLFGQSSGGAVRDLWLDPEGLAVKEERQVRLRVRSPFVGVLTYEERASFLLTGRP